MRVVQPSFSKGEISPDLRGRIDTAAYQVSLDTALNVIIHAYGGASNRPGLRFRGYCLSNSVTSRLRRFQFKTSDAYVLEFGHGAMRVFRNGECVTEAARAITGFTGSSPAVVTHSGAASAVGDRVYITGVGGATELNGRWFNAGAGTTSGSITLYDPVTGDPVDGSTYGAWTSGGTVAKAYTLATPYDAADLAELKFVQSADVVTITHRNYAARRLSRTGHTNWTLTAPAFTPSIAAPASGTAAGRSGFTGTDSVYYKVTATNADQEESIALELTCADSASPPFDASNYLRNDLAWAAVTGATKYTIYRAQGGLFGLLGESTTNSFFDDNFAPDLTTSPPEARDPITSSGEYPGCSTYYEQRQVYGGSTNHPDTCYYTRTGNYDSFSVSTPLQDDDAITATLTSREVNEIRHLVPGNDLLVFTSGSEWRVNSGGDNAFAASTIRQKPQSSWGSSHAEPIVIGATVLFVQANLITVRSVGYSLQQDGYISTDLTTLASHLFKPSQVISDWAFARSPDPIIYAVRSDGYACCLTFQQEQEVVGWSRWKTSGSFEAVASLQADLDDPDDETYFVVKRTVNGHTVRYIESTASRRFDDVRDAFFVDSGVSVDSPVAITGILLENPVIVNVASHSFVTGDTVAVSDIVWEPDVDERDNETQPAQLNGRQFTVSVLSSTQLRLTGTGSDGTGWNAYVSGGKLRKTQSVVGGLHHLEGREVVALCDGNVVSNLTVEDGQVTLPRGFARIHVGLRYVSDIVTLPVDVPRRVAMGVRKKASQVILNFLKTRGCWVGTGWHCIDEFPQREFEDYGDPTALLTGTISRPLSSDWSTTHQIYLRQSDPLPMTLLAVVSDVDMED